MPFAIQISCFLSLLPWKKKKIIAICFSNLLESNRAWFDTYLPDKCRDSGADPQVKLMEQSPFTSAGEPSPSLHSENE